MQRTRNDLRQRIIVGMTVVFLLGFSFYSLRGLLQPDVISARFGAPVTDGNAVLYFRVYLSRNVALILAGSAFLALGEWRPLAILMTLIAALPLFDAGMLMARYGSEAPLAFHLSAFVVVAMIASLLWRRPANEKQLADAVEE